MTTPLPPTLQSVVDAANAWASETAKAAIAPVQTQVNDLLTRLTTSTDMVTSLQKQVADLTQQLAAAKAPPAPTPKVLTTADFSADSNTAGVLLTDSFIGRSPELDVFAQEKYSSTRASTKIGATNPFHWFEVQTGKPGVQLKHFTVQCTPQGHDYHAMRLEGLINAVVEDVVVNGGCGSAKTPPGETFRFTAHKTTGLRINKLSLGLDGNADVASIFALNGAVDTQATDVLAKNAKSFGAALWQSDKVRLKNFTSIAGRGINLERDTDVIIDGLNVNVTGSPFGGDRVHFLIRNDQQSSTYEIHLLSWAGTTAGDNLFRCYIPLGYNPDDGTKTNTTKNLAWKDCMEGRVKFYGPDGNLMKFADEGKAANAGYAAVPKSNLDNAKADPMHWVVLTH